VDIAPARAQIDAWQAATEYLDVHRWRFTPSSFALLIQDLRDLGYHDLAEVGSSDTVGFEFFVSLGKGVVEVVRRDRLAMLETIEEELHDAVDRGVAEATAAMTLGREARRIGAALRKGR
jgi:hypothetical protein